MTFEICMWAMASGMSLAMGILGVRWMAGWLWVAMDEISK